MSSALRLLGQWARWALPIGACLGVLWPALATLLQPLLPAAVIATLTASLLRLDWEQLADWVRHPRLPLALAAAQLLLSPLAIWALASTGLIPQSLVVISVLQAAGAPIGSAAAFALFMGLPGHLCLVSSLLCTLLLPITLTVIVSLLLPTFGIEVALLPFFMRVTLYALTPFLLAVLLRRMVSVPRLRRLDPELAGVNVIALVIFAIAIMDGVTESLFAQPGWILALFGWSILAAAFWHAVGFLAFRPAGFETGMAASLTFGSRNMGLLLVVTAGTAGEDFQLYCGLAQLPMYFVPLVLGPIVSHLRPGGRGAAPG
jgi:BASS family bile acid:Na+ symporter